MTPDVKNEERESCKSDELGWGVSDLVNFLDVRVASQVMDQTNETRSFNTSLRGSNFWTSHQHLRMLRPSPPKLGGANQLKS
mmetsp:Transcript_13970/g.30123  ORF Transcript_13970/g.30123 Transcript_13970/m.30123 type:complete len:82 (-) Transcript_13970:92-337(-)